ncbi:Uncharacterised protein [Megamonas hypermegale]|uniref:Uncharacterized protein n=1 Tax=Megamonas hypermegale TaxID=158847 RepID=A0A239TKJ1_9FIRM|nr:hypothetical protein [Megamonas hypermegale]SNU98240.1 Uncharacterised protein [Megamonas hypermegale]
MDYIKTLNISFNYCEQWHIQQAKLRNLYNKKYEIQNALNTDDKQYKKNWLKDLDDIRFPIFYLIENFGYLFLTVSFFVGIIYTLIEGFYGTLDPIFIYYFNKKQEVFFLMFIVLITSIVIIGHCIIIDKTYNKDLKIFHKFKEEAVVNLPILCKLIENEENIFYRLEKEMYVKCIIPQKYWEVSNVLKNYILDCRANNLTDAINLYEYELVLKRQTQLIEEQTRAARETEKYSKIAAEESKRAADNAGLAVFFSFMAYYEASKKRK